jgi:glycosyltransferase involved in cell wall biosynthesis
MEDARGLVSIIIPTLNEQNGIKLTIKSIPTSLIKSKLGYEVEILVVDGGSMDSTREIATKLGARVIVEKHKGYGRACKSGFAAARGEILVTVDADNTYPAEYIADYIEVLDEKNLDFITVNRFSGMEKGAMSLTRRVGNKILTLATRTLYSVDINDSQSGMWIMRKKFISRVRLNSDDMSMSEEIKIIAFRFFNALEVDGKYHARTGAAKLKVIQDGWKNLKFLFDYKKKIQSSLTSSVGGEEEEIQLRGQKKTMSLF